MTAGRLVGFVKGGEGLCICWMCVEISLCVLELRLYNYMKLELSGVRVIYMYRYLCIYMFVSVVRVRYV